LGCGTLDKLLILCIVEEDESGCFSGKKFIRKKKEKKGDGL